jgi:ABC-2 type transport system ATP-binding protein
MNDQYAIATDGLTKRYGSFEAVHALNLRVGAQQITGFLGRNGAGKSTTIKILLGMMHPTSGKAAVLGRRIEDTKESLEMRRHVAYVGEDKPLYGYMTVEQIIGFTRSFYSDWRLEAERRLLKQFQLPLERKVRSLSKGMRTKLALLIALARRPQLLILDEPSEGLDPVSIEELLQELVVAASDGVTVFFSSHQIAEVERIADHICMIDHGKLVRDLSLDDMRREYRRITLGFATEPCLADFRIPGIEQIKVSGRQITMLASTNSEAVVSQAHHLNAVSVDVAPVCLREVFLDTVRE